jgi:hypothetical protein
MKIFATISLVVLGALWLDSTVAQITNPPCAVYPFLRGYQLIQGTVQ